MPASGSLEPLSVRAPLPPSEAAQLERMVEVGRAAWPDLAVDAGELARHLAAARARPAELATLHAADLYLAVGCARGDRRAIAALDARLAAVPDYVARITRDATRVDDLIQDLRTRLLVGPPPKIAQYAGTGALGGWLRIIAVRAALNLGRGAAVRPAGPVAEEPIVAEHALIAAQTDLAFRGALTRSLAALAPDERNLLRLHYFHGLTIDQLAATFERHRATVIRQLHRIRERVLIETRAQLAHDLRLSTEELDHVIEHARARLELTISRVLR